MLRSNRWNPASADGGALLQTILNAGQALKLSLLSCVLVAAISTVVIAGWVLEIPGLVQLSPTVAPMQFNTALCFALSASALILLILQRPVSASSLAVVSGIFATLVGLQYVTGWNLGIDTFFVDPVVSTETSHPGRMAPNTAVLFILFSIVVLISSYSLAGRLRDSQATLIASLILGYCIFVLIGYAGSLESSFKWAGLTSMAIQTAFGFLFLALAYLAFSWHRYRTGAADDAFPTWAAPASAIALIAIAAGGWHALSAAEQHFIQAELDIAAEGVEGKLYQTVDHHSRAYNRLVNRYERSGLSKGVLDADLDDYFSDQKDLAYAFLTSPHGDLTRIRNSPGQDGATLDNVERRFRDRLGALENSSNNDRIQFSVLSDPVGGRPLFILSRSISDSEAEAASQIWFAYDIQSLIAAPNSTVDQLGFVYDVRIRDLSEEVQARSAPIPAQGQDATNSFSIGGTDWTVTVWSDPDGRSSVRSVLPETILCLGLMTSLLAGGSVHLLRRAKMQETATKRLNESLTDEVEARRRSEHALDRLKRRFELILDSAGEGIFGLDADGVTTFANQAAERLTGWRREDMSGHNQHTLVHHSRADGSDYPQSECPIYATLTDGSIQAVEDEVFWRKDGTSFPVEYISSPIVDAEGKTEGAVVVFRDVTLRKQQEDELKRVNSELSATNSELEAFCYSVSHDLRAPLRAISGFSEVLNEDYGDAMDDEGRRYLDRICGAAARMSKLIDDLLALSRLTRQEMQVQAVDLSKVAQDLVQELRDGNPERVVDIHIADDCKALADERLMRAVLQNLLGNAWKFTRKSDAARIEFGQADADQPGVKLFYVRDNGAGFDMTYAAKLFAPFQRLHKQEEFEGTGVGLATVQRAIHRHNGRIWAESEPGKGATFYFEI